MVPPKASNGVSKARATLVAQRQKIVGKLANMYSSKSLADLISVSAAIEPIDEMADPPGPFKVDIGSPVSAKNPPA